MKITKRVLALYPELTLFPNDEDRIKSLKQCAKGLNWQWFRRPWFWAITIGYGVLGMVLPALITRALAAWGMPGGFRWWVQMIPSMMLGAGFGLAFQYLYRKPIQLALRKLLNDRGTPICMECGYDLRGLPEPRCPECGTHVGSALSDTAGDHMSM